MKSLLRFGSSPAATFSRFELWKCATSATRKSATLSIASHLFVSRGDTEAPTSGLPLSSAVFASTLAAFAFLTWSTWLSVLMLRWMTPTAPSLASSTAILHSVTVSIGEETRGKLSLMFFVRFEERSISLGSTSLRPGKRMKSRNV